MNFFLGSTFHPLHRVNLTLSILLLHLQFLLLVLQQPFLVFFSPCVPLHAEH